MNIKKYKQRKDFQKKIGKDLLNIWYFLMKPLALTLDKIEKYKNNKINKQVNQMTEKQFIELFTKLYIKKRLKYNLYNDSFIVANSTDYEENGIYTILEYIYDIRFNEKISKVIFKWLYRYEKKYKLDRKYIAVRYLTDLFKNELEKYDYITCKYEINERDKWYSRDYENTLVIKFNI